MATKTKEKTQALVARMSQRAADREHRKQAAALGNMKSLALGLFIAGRHRARCELKFAAAVQRHKDEIGFKGRRFEKDSVEWHAMLAATDPVYRRLEIARHLEKHAKALLTKAWHDADLKADETDFWDMSDRMSVDASAFLLDYCATNRLTVANIREAGLEDEEEVSLRRAEANAQAAAELMAEAGISA